MLSLTASLLTATTAVSVVLLSATLALLGLEYRGVGFLTWLRRNRPPLGIVGGAAIGLGVSLTSVAAFVRPPLIAATVSVVMVLAAGLIGIGLEFRSEALALLGRESRARTVTAALRPDPPKGSTRVS